jgi:hypothetical protein
MGKTLVAQVLQTSISGLPVENMLPKIVENETKILLQDLVQAPRVFRRPGSR